MTSLSPSSARAAAALGWREIVRFFRQRNRIIGSIGTPLVFWLLFGAGPGPGEASRAWRKEHQQGEAAKLAIKCDMCSGIEGGPACVRACPSGAAIRVAPEKFLTFTKLEDVG